MKTADILTEEAMAAEKTVAAEETAVEEKLPEKETTTVNLARRRDVSKNPLCLSGKGVTREFHAGGTKTVAVDHVDFEFREGELVSILGVSGVGKTTLFQVISGLTRPDEAWNMCFICIITERLFYE